MHCALAVLFSLALSGQDDAIAARYRNHRELTYYVDEAGKQQPIDSRAAWQRRRAHVLAGMQAAMGKLPSRENLPPLDVQVLETVQGKGFTRLKISFVAEAGDRVPAHLFLPDAAKAKPAPAMLALHQTTSIGKDEPAGLGGLENLHYGLELAERGFVVLAPDYPSFGDYKYDFKAGDYVSGTMKGIFNHMRCVDLLQSRSEVDPERIGVIGHSLGGHNAMFVAAFDERLKAIVSSCGWTPFHDYYDGKIAGWTSDRYMPRLRDVYGLDPDRVPFDFYEIVASFAPRGFFPTRPWPTATLPWQGSRKASPRHGRFTNCTAIPNGCKFVVPNADTTFRPKSDKKLISLLMQFCRRHRRDYSSAHAKAKRQRGGETPLHC